MSGTSGVLAGGDGGAMAPSVKIFRGRQKLEEGAKFACNDARTFVRNSKFGKTEELFNSFWRLCFAEERVAKMARAL